MIISIHSLHTEGDIPQDRETACGGHFNPLPPHGGRLPIPQIIVSFLIFQSTPSTRRETDHSAVRCTVSRISIHSLHTEGDLLCHQAGSLSHISIHSLHTEGDLPHDHSLTINSEISIHSLHTEGDVVQSAEHFDQVLFQSTPSTRRETFSSSVVSLIFSFQSTPSTRRET